MLEPRRVISPDDPAIAGFGRLQAATYFEPDMLIPPQYIASMLGWSDARRQNALIVLEDAGEVVAGTLFHYLARVQVGFSSYLAVARERRGQGLARRLHEARNATLEAMSNGAYQGVFIDVVNPTRLNARELEEERSVGSDPVTRLKAFSSLGFKRVDVKYEQPVGGEDGGPVTNMDLLFCPRASVDSVPTALVVDTMREYWTPWLGQGRAERAARELEARAGGDGLRLLPLL